MATWATGRTQDLVQALRPRRLERRTAAALQALDDATLKDFGLYRCEIPSIARVRVAGMLAALAALAVLSAAPARAEVAANGLTANGTGATRTGAGIDFGAIARATIAR